MRNWLMMVVVAGLVTAAGAVQTTTDYFNSRLGVDVALVVNAGDLAALTGPAALTPAQLYATYGNLTATDWIDAVETWNHPAWATATVQFPSEAKWISTSYYIGQYNSETISGNSWRWFEDNIPIMANPYAVLQTPITGTLNITADNAEAVFINGVFVASDGEVSGAFIDNQEWGTVKTYNIAPFLVAGDNELRILVRNYSGPTTPTTNPTGLIYSGEYTYPTSLEVEIDIKPCSNPNSFNINGHGTIPVAILGSATFEVTEINVATLDFQGLTVGVRGRDKLMVSYADVIGPGDPGDSDPCGADGYEDLVIHFADDGSWEPAEGYAVLSGFLKDGTPFSGAGPINLVPSE